MNPSMNGAGLGTWIFMLSSRLRIKAGKKMLEYNINALVCACFTKGAIST
jgi:hypothetical protein